MASARISRPARFGLVLGLVLVLGACSRDDFALQTASEIDALTDEIIATIEHGEDKRVALGRAQALLDARRIELEPRWNRVRALRGLQLSDETAAVVSETIDADVAKLAVLRINLMLATSSDPELAAALLDLSTSYSELIDGE